METAVGSGEGTLLSLAVRVPTKELAMNSQIILVDKGLLGQEGYELGMELHGKEEIFLRITKMF